MRCPAVHGVGESCVRLDIIYSKRRQIPPRTDLLYRKHDGAIIRSRGALRGYSTTPIPLVYACEVLRVAGGMYMAGKARSSQDFGASPSLFTTRNRRPHRNRGSVSGGFYRPGALVSSGGGY